MSDPKNIFQYKCQNAIAQFSWNTNKVFVIDLCISQRQRNPGTLQAFTPSRSSAKIPWAKKSKIITKLPQEQEANNEKQTDRYHSFLLFVCNTVEASKQPR